MRGVAVKIETYYYMGRASYFGTAWPRICRLQS